MSDRHDAGVEPERHGRRRAVVLGSLIALVAVTCFGLGVWQLQRRLWKLDLMARIEAHVGAPAVSPPSPALWPSLDPSDQEYRRVAMIGTFRHEQETLVRAVTERGPGYWVLTPLDTEAGFTVLVNRGFVPPDRRMGTTRRAGNVEGPTSTQGLLRLSEPRGGFLRTNDPSAERWFSRDVSAIAAARGLGSAPAYFVDADATANSGGLPIGGLTVVGLRNAHLAYAVTWFVLSAMAIAALLRLRRIDATG